MRHLRIFRSLLAIIFFAAAVAFLCIGPGAHPMAVIAKKTQIILSALSVTLGATLVWLLITFLLGRVYCSTVCPIGSITDFCARAGRKLLRRPPYSWKKPNRLGYFILPGYILCLVIGLVGIPFLIEPWNMMGNVASVINADAITDTWLNFGYSASTGILAGIVSLLLVVIWSAICGRDFCNTLCPVGTALGLVGRRALMHIEIDHDKCNCCGKCEEACPAHCISTLDRSVDNARCLRCFDCLAACEHDAIRYQLSRNLPLTPLFRRRRSPTH